ncbi:MAG: hypothetical protein IJ017_03860 [Oscillospiraceae bacterium]|nr:hypothetical protein [Oscillospiraceae bacterium]
MKKVYNKPQIMFESFILSTNIAGDCEVDTDLKSNDDCGLDFSGKVVFLDTMNGCKGGIEVEDVGGDGIHNGICYHISQGQNLFNS